MIAKAYSTTSVNQPKQARSVRYLERVVEAASELVNKSGIDALTMTALTQGADLSVGGIYRYFTTKIELLRFVKDYFLSQFELEVKEAFEAETASIADVVDILFDLHITRMEGKENFWRFIINPPDADPVMIERGREAIRKIESVFCEAGLRHQDKMQRKNPEAVLRNAYHFAFSILTLRLRYSTASSAFAWRNLRVEGTRAIIAYLEAPETLETPVSRKR